MRKYKNFFNIWARKFRFRWVFLVFLGLGWKVQGSVTGNIRKAFFWENLRKTFFWENIRNFFKYLSQKVQFPEIQRICFIFRFWAWKVHQVVLLYTTIATWRISQKRHLQSRARNISPDWNMLVFVSFQCLSDPSNKKFVKKLLSRFKMSDFMICFYRDDSFQ